MRRTGRSRADGCPCGNVCTGHRSAGCHASSAYGNLCSADRRPYDRADCRSYDRADRRSYDRADPGRRDTNRCTACRRRPSNSAPNRRDGGTVPDMPWRGRAETSPG